MLDKAQIERAHMAGQIKHEVSIMRRLKHPNVVELKDVMATKSKVSCLLAPWKRRLSSLLILILRLPALFDARQACVCAD